MKVIIHSCDKRLWYVKGFLVPALRDQGIEPTIHNDDHHRGCLWSYIDSFRSLPADTKGTWHIEDDVFPCQSFVNVARAHDDGIVHGFFHRFGNDDLVPGWVSVNKAGYSFPCFRMPNRLIAEFADWFLAEGQHRDKYRRWIDENKHIDSFMLDFLREKHPEEKVFNLKPSIVDHVDYLIGGSVVNKFREGKCKAEYFNDRESIEELKIKLAHR